MTVRAHPRSDEAPQSDLSPETEAKILAGIDAIEHDKVVVLTRAQVERWAVTGELPEAWAASLSSRI
jgi:hypothetical protein